MIHVRNVKTPMYGSDGAHYKFSTWFHREVLLAGRWTEVANDGDGAWTSNYSATYSDLYVLSGQPLKVYRAAGFSAPPANSALTLIDQANDANCIVAKISSYDANSVTLDTTNIAKPLVPATGLAGKIHVFGQTTLLAAGAWTVLAAPGTAPDRFQIRLEVGTTANRPWLFAYPKGDYSTLKSVTSGFTWAYGATERRSIINADVDGENFVLFDWNGYTTATIAGPYIWCGGRLIAEDAEDACPYFIATNANTSWVGCTPGWDWSQWQIYMIDHMYKQLPCYAEFQKYMSDLAYSSCLWKKANWWENYDRRTARQYPFVVAGDVPGGGYRRGRWPWIAIHEQWKDWLTIDISGGHRTAPGALLVDSAGLTGCDASPPLMVF